MNFSDPFGLCPPPLVPVCAVMLGFAWFGGSRVAINAAYKRPLNENVQRDAGFGMGLGLGAGSLATAPIVAADATATTAARVVMAGDAIGGGLVSAGGTLSRLLPEIEAQIGRVNPTSAATALDAIAKATQNLGLEVGKITQLANGGIQILSRGGVTTNIGANGSVLIERGKDVLLNLPR